MIRAMAARQRKCANEDCERLVTNTFGYCRAHYMTALKCYFEDCDGRVPIYTRSHLCSEHRHLHNTLRLDQGSAERP